MQDEFREGRPKSVVVPETIDAERQLILQDRQVILDDRRITIREVADDVGISSGSCKAIFMDVLGMKRAAAKIFPKLLNFEPHVV